MEITKKVLENGMTQLQVTLPAEDYEKAIREEYEAERYDIELPNYPKGQVPMKEAEKAFGPNFLNNSAATRLMSEHHGKAVVTNHQQLELVRWASFKIYLNGMRMTHQMNLKFIETIFAIKILQIIETHLSISQAGLTLFGEL